MERVPRTKKVFSFVDNLVPVLIIRGRVDRIFGEHIKMALILNLMSDFEGWLPGQNRSEV